MKISLFSSSLRYPSQFGILIAGKGTQFVLFIDYVPTELDEYVVDKEPHYTHDSETVFIKRIEFLIHNIFAMFGGCVFQYDSRHFYGYQFLFPTCCVIQGLQ
jgi:hypothetical protein